ncbi:MAG: phosphatidate cytidylyltransferase [Bacteroidales bacterium]|jgi:phosphatidate cytidylyltransferase|nr:phosphatidate cytidylyltransferase [Bacteroidales bacterium]
MIKNLLTRTLTGILYVALTIAALYSYSWVFFGIFAIFMLGSLKELCGILAVKNHRIPQLFAYFFAIALFTLSCGNVFFSWQISYSLAVIPLLLALCLHQICNKKSENPVETIANTIFSVVYVALPFCLLAYIVGGTINTLSTQCLHVAACMFILIWSNDTFAYLWGISFGKHRLCPRISPKKSVEGFVGGLISTLALAFFIPYCIDTSLGRWQWVGAAAVIVTAATFGDLFESSLKRYAEVKDSGTILPGHGGFLDRLDSVLFAIPSFYVYLQIILLV